MRAWSSLVLLTMLGCELPEKDLAGSLVRVTVEAGLNDDCRPRRFSGDAGVQFFGVQDDGGAVFTLSRTAKYGPILDGGVLEGGEAQVEHGERTLPENACSGSYSDWVRVGDGRFDLRQSWVGADECPTGPWWLPERACVTERRFTFTELGPCQLRCVKYQLDGQVTCDC